MDAASDKTGIVAAGDTGTPPPNYSPTPADYFGNGSTHSQPLPTQQPPAAVDEQEESDDDEDYALSKHVQVSFQKVFPEPISSDSFKLVQGVNKNIFNYTQVGCYRLLSTLLGWLFSLVFGLVFATCNFGVVWAVQPALKLVFIYLRVARTLFRAVLRALVDPLCASLGLTLSRIRAVFSLDVKERGVGAGGVGGSLLPLSDPSLQRI